MDELKADLNSSAEELIVIEIISPYKIRKELATEGSATGEKLGVLLTIFPQVRSEEDPQNRIEFTDRRLTRKQLTARRATRKMGLKQVERVPWIPIKLFGLRARKAA